VAKAFTIINNGVCSVYRIGELSKLSRVPVSALRYYSDRGLLPPEVIDRDSGYRYYSATQLPRLNRILALKDLGLSLDEIKSVLNDELSAAELRGMLRLKRAEIGQAMAEHQAQLTRVENRLRVIEREGNMPDQEIVTKVLDPVHVIFLRETLNGVNMIPGMIEDGYAAVMAAGVTPTAPGFSVFHDPEFKPNEFDYEIAFPVPEGTSIEVTPNGRKFGERVVPGGKAAVLVHRGPYEQMDEAYGRIGQWIADHGLQVAGPPQEAYLTPPDDPQGPITELRFSVQ